MATSTQSSAVSEKQTGRNAAEDTRDTTTASDVPLFKWSHLWEQPIMSVHSTRIAEYP